MAVHKYNRIPSFNPWKENTPVSLAVIFGVLALSMLLSYIVTKQHDRVAG